MKCEHVDRRRDIRRRCRCEVKHYRPTDRLNHIHVINWKTGTGEWEPLFDDNGEPLYATLIRDLDEIKAKRPTGGLMLRRDGKAARGSARTNS